MYVYLVIRSVRHEITTEWLSADSSDEAWALVSDRKSVESITFSHVGEQR